MTEPHDTTTGPVEVLTAVLRDAIAAVLGERDAAAAGDIDPQVRPSQNSKFGDFQANFAMRLGKQIDRNPRELAQQVAEALDDRFTQVAEAPEVAGPGFINITLKNEAVAGMLDAMDTETLGVRNDPDTHAVVIDLCAVNIAKQMHVGHLRSTIIGDALARVFERLGRTVFRENHLGDWGLPIAMVLHHLREAGTNLDTLELIDLDRAYRTAQTRGKDDPETIDAAKQTLVKLQHGDPDLDRDWRKLIDCTLRALYEALELLNVKLGPENNRGESFYRDRLDGVIKAYRESGLAQEDDGALVVPFADRERPLLIQKSDGGFLYATTDLAAIRFRTAELNADRVIYVVDARQRDHFRDVFDAVRLMGWDATKDGARAELHHVAFGSVLGPDKTPLKTRSGENVTLRQLLDEACERGMLEVKQRANDPKAPTHGLPDEALASIGRMVGIGAIKYADLSNDLVRDYVFDMNRMVAFDGDTGPYLQYAHARICSIFAKSGVDEASLDDAPLAISQDAEKQLALKLLQYGGVVADVARSLEPHRLCAYLYDLANAYSTFYEQCPVLKAETERIRSTRLRLCRLMRRVLADGLELLGIEAPRQM